MTSWRVIGTVAAACGVGLGYLAVRSGGAATLALWPAAALLVAGGAYVVGSPRPFGKRADGSQSPLSVALMLPYLAAHWGLWRMQRRTWKRAKAHEVSPGLWLGQRPLAGELPPGTTLVVDLTCEFAADPAVLSGAAYVCLPTLDGRSPEGDALARLVREVAAHDGIIYVHCAAGHGRSAVVMACVLVTRGLATDGEEALRGMVKMRETINLTSEQLDQVARFRPLRGAFPC